MEPNPIQRAPDGANIPAGYVSNAGAQRYDLEAESSTGFIAWKIADGTTLISQSTQTDIAESLYVSFWACTSYTDPTAAGRITYFDCHGNHLSRLDVRALVGLEYLDCSFNELTQLPLDGLTDLQALDTDNNRLTSLEVRPLRALRVLNCANNRLATLDLSGLALLEIVDCSNNGLTCVTTKGCRLLRDFKADANRPGVHAPKIKTRTL
jgi:hypothetical protein